MSNRITNFQQGELNSTGTAISGTVINSQNFNLNALGSQLSTTTNGTVVDNASNEQNQLTSNGSATLTYDNNGNNTTDENGNTYTFDAWNHIVHVSLESGSETFTYNADGQRIAVGSTTGSVSYHSYYDAGGQDIEDWVSSTIREKYYWGATYVNDLVRQVARVGSGGTVTYFQHDADYSIIASANTSGVIGSRYSYGPYGALLSGLSGYTATATASLYLYQGGKIDPNTGLFWFDASGRGRDYDPTIGAWREQDGAGYINGLNLYQFVLSNPLNGVDPDGMSVVLPPTGSGNSGSLSFPSNPDGGWHSPGSQNGPVDVSQREPSSNEDVSDPWGMNYFAAKEAQGRDIPPPFTKVLVLGKEDSYYDPMFNICYMGTGHEPTALEMFLTMIPFLPEVGMGAKAMETVVDAGADAAESAVGTGTRYVGPGEAQVIQDTGMVPNTNAIGDPKTVFYTPDAPLDSASAAQQAYNLPTTPTNVVTVDPSGIENVYGGNVENGTGIELGTQQQMPGTNVQPLKP